VSVCSEKQYQMLFGLARDCRCLLIKRRPPQWDQSPLLGPVDPFGFSWALAVSLRKAPPMGLGFPWGYGGDPVGRGERKDEQITSGAFRRAKARMGKSNGHA
jgi:hypothetical protein